MQACLTKTSFLILLQPEVKVLFLGNHTVLAMHAMHNHRPRLEILLSIAFGTLQNLAISILCIIGSNHM